MATPKPKPHQNFRLGGDPKNKRTTKPTPQDLEFGDRRRRIDDIHAQRQLEEECAEVWG